MKKPLVLLLCAVMTAALSTTALAAPESELYPETYDSAWESREDGGAYPDARHREIEQFRAENPGVLEAAEGTMEQWFFSEYYWRQMTAEEYKESYGLDDEAFRLEVTLAWIENYELETARQAAIDAEKRVLGGTPGEPGVMLDGAYVSFDAARPLLRDGSMLAPLDGLLRAFQLDALPEGSRAACTEIDGITYCAVRALAEELGYQVFWDRPFQTAVVIDRKGLTERFDTGHFTVLNGVLSALHIGSQLEGHSALRGTMATAVGVTLYNSLDGDKRFQMTADAAFHQSMTASSIDMTMDLSALPSLLREILPAGPDTLADYFGLTPAQYKVLEAALNELRFSARMDMEQGALYYNVPILALLVPGMDAGAWGELDLDAVYPPGTLERYAAAPPTAAELICMFAETGYGEYYYSNYYGASLDRSTPVFAYAGMKSALEQAAALAGDKAFAAKGGARVLTLDGERIAALLSDPDDSYAAFQGFREFEFVLTVKQDGDVSLAFAIRPELLYSYVMPEDFRVAGRLELSRGKSSAEVEFHLKNRVKVELSAESVWTPTNDPVAAAPPPAKLIRPVEFMQNLFS